MAYKVAIPLSVPTATVHITNAVATPTIGRRHTRLFSPGVPVSGTGPLPDAFLLRLRDFQSDEEIRVARSRLIFNLIEARIG